MIFSDFESEYKTRCQLSIASPQVLLSVLIARGLTPIFVLEG